MKSKTIPQLVKELDKVFSLYIRKKYSDNGMVKCFTCANIRPIKEIQAGHFQSRRHFSTRWDERNVRPQCISCNIFNQGQQDRFGMRLRNEIGENEVNKVILKTSETRKLDKLELEESIKYYKNLIK